MKLNDLFEELSEAGFNPELQPNCCIITIGDGLYSEKWAVIPNPRLENEVLMFKYDNSHMVNKLDDMFVKRFYNEETPEMTRDRIYSDIPCIPEIDLVRRFIEEGFNKDLIENWESPEAREHMIRHTIQALKDANKDSKERLTYTFKENPPRIVLAPLSKVNHEEDVKNLVKNTWWYRAAYGNNGV